VRAVDYGYVSGFREPSTPISEGEANDTELAISRIPIRYQPAVRQWWMREGLSLREHAQAMPPQGVNHETFQTWVIRGHEELRKQLAILTQLWRDQALSNAALHAHRKVM
jgi:DNA-directed RNA polymerase specialized sigma24 family protein